MKQQQPQHRKRITLTAAVLTASLTALPLLSGCESGNIAGAMGAGPYDQVYDLSGAYTTLDVMTDIADITICTGDTASLEVHMDKWYTIDREQKGDTLYVTERNDGPFWQKFFHFDSVHNDIIITLPDAAVKDLIVTSDVGNVVISGLTLDSAAFTLDTGNLNLTDCTTDMLQIKSDTGNLNLADCTSDTLQLESDTGNMKVISSVAGMCTMKEDTGNISIENSALKNYTAVLDTGDITGSGLDIGSADIQINTGDIKTEFVSLINLQTETDTGDVRMVLPGAPEEYDYDLQTDSGSIAIGSDKKLSSGSTYVVSEGKDSKLTLSSDSGDIDIQFSGEVK